MSLIIDWFKALDAVVDRELQSMRGEQSENDEENQETIFDSIQETIDQYRGDLEKTEAEFQLANALKESLEKENEALENKLHRIGHLLTTHGLGAEQCAAIKGIIAEPSRVEAHLAQEQPVPGR